MLNETFHLYVMSSFYQTTQFFQNLHLTALNPSVFERVRVVLNALDGRIDHALVDHQLVAELVAIFKML